MRTSDSPRLGRTPDRNLPRRIAISHAPEPRPGGSRGRPGQCLALTPGSASGRTDYFLPAMASCSEASLSYSFASFSWSATSSSQCMRILSA